MSKKKTGYYLIMPALLMVMVVSVYPVMYSLRLSFYEGNLLRKGTIEPFVGLSNYVRVAGDSFFQNSLRVTGIFVSCSVGLATLLGLLIALILNKEKKFHRITKRILILPFVISPALVGFSWRFFLNPEFGIVDYLLKFFLPVDERLVWLGNKHWALASLILVDCWVWTPFITLIFSAGLASIPQELYDAVRVDGASKFQVFRFVTLPLLFPTVAVALIIKTIYAVKEFDTVFLMTRGGPGRATEVIGYYVYKAGFIFFHMGDAAAITYLVVIIMTILAALYLKMLTASYHSRSTA